MMSVGDLEYPMSVNNEDENKEKTMHMAGCYSSKSFPLTDHVMEAKKETVFCSHIWKMTWKQQ